MSELNLETKTTSFEESLKELENIVRKLESGQTNLEDAIKDYERGNELRKNCEQRLAEARLKVEKIIKNSDGNIAKEEISYDE
ncbi:MAG: exodeoxyribonuclease VII small subunit [Alphaproteobacteria bacterium CG11_big_fil_rev_8_21_14_0_20_44_7]|nr:MAG: exodeoxyribonuclease VII small subunit [Alphaproteobacteria bacterium CG11_big_fil_rev_8_21_14_0_20_44_7]